MIRTLLTAVLLSVSTSALATDFSMFFDEELVMASLQERAPARAEYLASLRETDPQAYYQQLYWTTQVVFIDAVDPELREGAIELWNLTGLLSELADQFVEASPDERAAVRADMLEVAAELEALERTQAGRRIVSINKQLTNLDSRLSRMEANTSRRTEQKVRQAIKLAKSR